MAKLPKITSQNSSNKTFLKILYTNASKMKMSKLKTSGHVTCIKRMF